MFNNQSQVLAKFSFWKEGEGVFLAIQELVVLAKWAKILEA